MLEGTGPDGWDVSAQPSSQALAATAVVGAGDTENIKATVKPAFDAAAGQYLIDVTATAGDYRAEAQLGVEITGSYSLRLTTADQRLSHQRHRRQQHGVPGPGPEHRLGGPRPT